MKTIEEVTGHTEQSASLYTCNFSFKSSPKYIFSIYLVRVEGRAEVRAREGGDRDTDVRGTSIGCFPQAP